MWLEEIKAGDAVFYENLLKPVYTFLQSFFMASLVTEIKPTEKYPFHQKTVRINNYNFAIWQKNIFSNIWAKLVKHWNWIYIGHKSLSV